MTGDEMPDDPLPALIAELDQALSMAPQLARMAMGYYREFEEAGFSSSQAIYLTACQLHGEPGNAP